MPAKAGCKGRRRERVSKGAGERREAAKAAEQARGSIERSKRKPAPSIVSARARGTAVTPERAGIAQRARTWASEDVHGPSGAVRHPRDER